MCFNSENRKDSLSLARQGRGKAKGGAAGCLERGLCPKTKGKGIRKVGN